MPAISNTPATPRRRIAQAALSKAVLGTSAQPPSLKFATFPALFSPLLRKPYNTEKVRGGENTARRNCTRRPAMRRSVASLMVLL